MGKNRSEFESLIALAPNYEWTVEANPGSADSAVFAIWRDMGVNRCSLGIQAMQEHHLQWLGRVHSASEAATALDLALSIFPRVSADMIIGLPEQTMPELAATLDFLLQRPLQHMSLYHFDDRIWH